MLWLWPGGKGLGFKKHRPGGPCFWRRGLSSDSGGGPIGRPAGRPYQDLTFHGDAGPYGRPRLRRERRLMVFGAQTLAPGPGTQLRATFRWRPIQSALSGSLFFKPPALPEVMTILRHALCSMRSAPQCLTDNSRYTPTMAKMKFASQAARKGGKLPPLPSSRMNE